MVLKKMIVSRENGVTGSYGWITSGIGRRAKTQRHEERILNGDVFNAHKDAMTQRRDFIKCAQR